MILGALDVSDMSDMSDAGVCDGPLCVIIHPVGQSFETGQNRIAASLLGEPVMTG